MALLAQIAALAAAYFITGRLGLLLAVPPGYATFIFPASGVALACILLYRYRLLPGVWLGSFLMNISLSLDASSLRSLTASALLPAFIATGALLQAGFGALLIRSLVGFPSLLEKKGDVYRFFLLAGPFSCLVGASVGASSLLAYSVITVQEYPYHWFTWWAGDVVGVFVFTPLVLILLSSPRELWRRRRITVGLPLIGVFILLTAFYLLQSRNETVQLRKDFERQAEAVVNALQTRILIHTEVLDSLGGLYKASRSVTRKDFREFLEQPLTIHRGIQAVAWAPRVRASEREAFVSSARREGLGGYRITQQAPEGGHGDAAARDEYYPVLFVEPLPGNEQALGYDISSEEVRRDAMARASERARQAATEPVTLVLPDRKNEPGLLTLLPVYAKDAPVETAGERRKALQGFLFIVFRIPDLLEEAVKGLNLEGLRLAVYDSDDRSRIRPLCRLPESPEEGGGKDRLIFRRATEIGFIDERWTLDISSTPAFTDKGQELQGELFLLGAMLTTGLFSIFLFIVSGYESATSKLVLERTGELSSANEALRESKERYSFVVDNLKEVVFRTDGEGHWTFLNRAWTEVTGFGVQQSLGRIFLDYVHPDDRQRNIELFRPLIEKKKDYCRHEIRYLHRDGGFRWIEVWARLTLDEKGNPTGTAGTLTDITDRKAAELRLRRLTQEKETILNTLTVGIGFIRDRKVQWVNPAHDRMFGYETGETAEMDTAAFYADEEDYRRVGEEGYAQLASGGVYTTETEMKRKDGTLFWARIVGRAVSPGNLSEGTIWMLEDITERKRMEEELRQLSLRDELTGLYNRRGLTTLAEQQLKIAERLQRGVLLFFADLDGMKRINDSFGHAEGDRALTDTAKILSETFRASDVIARVGGDEFIVLVLETDVTQGGLLLGRLQENLEIHNAQAGRVYRLSLSVGVTRCDQRAPCSITELMSRADALMYGQKKDRHDR